MFAYDPARHAMGRERLPDVEVNARVDELTARGLGVSVCWLDPDPEPTVDELLGALSQDGGA